MELARTGRIALVRGRPKAESNPGRGAPP
jgi:hypothetical protein